MPDSVPIGMPQHCVSARERKAFQHALLWPHVLGTCIMGAESPPDPFDRVLPQHVYSINT